MAPRSTSLGRTLVLFGLVPLIVAHAALLPRAVVAQERFPAGTVELGLVGGYGIRHASANDTELEEIHAVPHLGYFLTRERGSESLRGSLELLLEPTLIRLQKDDPANLVGVGLLARWVFTSGRRLHPYVEAGGGVLSGRPGLAESNCDMNFVAQGGVGLLVPVGEHVAVTAGYRFHHISNGNGCRPESRNISVNASVLLLGLSYFFP